MIPDLDRFDVGAWALALYLYNTNGEQFVRDVFGDVHPSYAAEKAEAFGLSPLRAIGFLDNERRARLLAVARERHGAAAAGDLP